MFSLNHFSIKLIIPVILIIFTFFVRNVYGNEPKNDIEENLSKIILTLCDNNIEQENLIESYNHIIKSLVDGVSLKEVTISESGEVEINASAASDKLFLSFEKELNKNPKLLKVALNSLKTDSESGLKNFNMKGEIKVQNIDNERCLENKIETAPENIKLPVGRLLSLFADSGNIGNTYMKINMLVEKNDLRLLHIKQSDAMQEMPPISSLGNSYVVKDTNIVIEVDGTSSMYSKFKEELYKSNILLKVNKETVKFINDDQDKIHARLSLTVYAMDKKNIQ